MRVFAAAGAAGLLFAALAGCSAAASGVGSTGGTHAPQASGAAAVAAPPANACALVLEADATTALGTDPGAGEETDGQHGASSCSFGQYPSLLIVNLIPADGKVSYDHLLADPASGSATPLTGIGDAAFLVSKSGTVGIDFYRGDAFVGVVLITGGDAPIDQATSLASALAQRL